MDDVAKVATLTAMGFGEDEALRALQQSSGNLEYAANLLLMGGGAADAADVGGSGTSSSSLAAGHYNDRPPGEELEAEEKENVVILAAVSQYDLPAGRSACTCIALAAADSMLLLQEQGDHTSTSTGCSYWSTESLTACLYRGHEIYLHYQQQQQQQQQNGSSVVTTTTEHTSAEELLPLFPNLQLMESSSTAGATAMVRQGLLTVDGSCWQELLTTDDAGPVSSTAFIITKPPETVLVYYHHNSTSSSWWLVDSHCRPPRFRQAYALRHETLPALRTSLQRLFPATPDIPGVSPIMMAMYNSVDVYPLRRRRPVSSSAGPNTTGARSNDATAVTTADDHNAEP
jgi:UBA/TS-N domain